MRKPFRLDPILSHKKRLEEIQQLRLARIREDHHRANSTLRDLEDNESKQLSSLAGEQTGAVDTNAIQRRLAYIERIRGDRARQGQIVEQLEGQVEENRDHLVSILKDKKTLEQLKERERERTAEEARRRDANVTDEITMTRFAREQRESAS
jgi:flagellar export protein FliJ